MKEVYEFDRFLSDVLGSVDASGAEGSVGEVRIDLIARQDLESRLSNPKRLRVSATLWNDLLDKLLPAAEVHPYDLKATERGLVRSPLYIPVEGEGRHKPVELRLLDFKKTREERAATILSNLTPEQRVALGHPAEYPPPDEKKANAQSGAGKGGRPGGNPLVRSSGTDGSAAGGDESGEGRWWLWAVSGLGGALLVWAMIRFARVGRGRR